MKPTPGLTPTPLTHTARPEPQRSSATPAALVVLGGVFGYMLYHWIQFSWPHELYSHLLLIPLCSAYFAWQQRARLETVQVRGPGEWAIIVFAGVCGLAGWLYFHLSSAALQDRLAVGVTGLALGAVGVVTFRHGKSTRALLFPLLFLLAAAPLPIRLETAIEQLLQHASAECAYLLFRIAGSSVYREDMVFHLPGISLMVAPQCSGIHSSLVLFVTSLVGGYVFLRNPVHRAVLALVVIPLGVLRNGFRVFVLGELCVHVDRDIIHSALHHRGGPIFFALSLIPFLALLWYLVRREAIRGRRRSPPPQAVDDPLPESR